jgi:peptidoglycan/LPS O-acetylase OafA/YrhL
LRAFAAVSVLVFHTAGATKFAYTSGYGLYTSRLNLGVSVFFLISGFLLYRPFAGAHLAGRPAISPGKFWLRRLLRIVPAYWLALTVITYVLRAPQIGGGWQAVAANYGFAQIYFTSYWHTGILQAWSLCTEMSFYLFLPLYAALLGFRRRPPAAQLRRELIALGVLVAVGVGFKIMVLNYHCVSNCPIGPAPFQLMIEWLPSYFDLFALGMFLAVMSTWYTERKSQPTWLVHPVMPWVSWACAAVVFVIVSHVGDPLAGGLSPMNEMLTRELYGVFAFFLLLPAVFGPQDRSLVRRLLSAWPVAAVGVVSYGVYLWQLAWLSEVFRWAGHRGWHTTVPFVFLTVVVLILAVGSSAASYFVVERPVLRLKDGIRPRPRAGGPTPAEPSPAPATSLTLP